MRVTYLTVLIFSMMAICYSCTSDPETEQNLELIQGRWEVEEAYRNNKLTDALDGIYFHFKPEQTILSNFNLSVKETKNKFTILKNTLTEEGTEKRVFNIEKISSSDLILTTKYQGLSFRLLLEKTSPE